MISCELEQILKDQKQSGSLTEERIVQGLKESLRLGSRKAALDLSEVDGYLGDALVRIMLPEEVEQVFTMVQNLEQNSNWQTAVRTTGNLLPALYPLRDSLFTALNRGAEKAAPLSVAIFSESISSLNLTTGRDILFGDSLGATTYLESTTRFQLDSLFQPIIGEVLDEVGANRLWIKFSTGYNQLTRLYAQARSQSITAIAPLPNLNFPNSLPTNLSAYTSEKALNGLFLKVGKQEIALRADPLQYLANMGNFVEDWARELLSEVFTAEE